MTRPLPDLAVDRHAWFDRVGADLLDKGWPAVLAAVKPCTWTSPSGHRWRLVRTDRSIEIRPELRNPFLRVGESLRVSAVAIGETIGVELTTRRWSFPLQRRRRQEAAGSGRSRTVHWAAKR